ncbi:MAG: SpoIIIAH-like family protein [Clostridia bacterium]|nr:SpoIIIAH-like family protein [Clostridia bacterium]
MSKKKKIIILSIMLGLLAVTAVLNYVFTANTITDGDIQTSASASYFSEYRSRRITTRNEELLQIDNIIASAEEGSIEKSEALKLKTELMEITEKELLLESLIKAYGFEDVVVIMSLSSDNINVIAKTNEITADDSIKIYSIIEEEQVGDPANVKIIPIV